MEDFYATLEVVKQCLHENPPECRRGVPKTKGEKMLTELMKDMSRKDVSVKEFRGVMDDLRTFLDDQYKNSEIFLYPGYKFLELWVNDMELSYSCLKEGVPPWMEGLAREVMGRHYPEKSAPSSESRHLIFEDLGPK